MKLLLDTSAYSAIFRGNASLATYLQNDVVIPSIVLGELRSGFAVGSKTAENERLLERFLNQSNVTVISITDKTTHTYAQVYSQLKTSGKPIGTNDMWIAAMCIEHSLPLLTLDRDFSWVQGLKCLDVTQNN